MDCEVAPDVVLDVRNGGRPCGATVIGGRPDCRYYVPSSANADRCRPPHAGSRGGVGVWT